MISNHQADILRHASNNGRYVCDELPDLKELAETGLFYDHGAQGLAGGMHYYTVTAKGRAALNEWQAAQPRPKGKKRRISPEFADWRCYVEACGRISFREFRAWRASK